MYELLFGMLLIYESIHREIGKKRCLERKFIFLVITEMHCETDNDFFVQKKTIDKITCRPQINVLHLRQKYTLSLTYHAHKLKL